MPEPSIRRAIDEVLSSRTLSSGQKIAKLRQFEADALAKQRGGTEGLQPNRPDDGEELRAIERALMSLGETAVDQGPASL